MTRLAPHWDPDEYLRDDLLIEADMISELRLLEELECPYFGDDEVDEQQEWHDYDPDC